MLSIGAFNALLKTLEERRNMYFILARTESQDTDYNSIQMSEI